MHGGHGSVSDFAVPLAGRAAYMSGTQVEPMEKNMKVVDNYRRWRRYRRTVNELTALSKRELDDLGISRHDIEQVAWNGGRP